MGGSAPVRRAFVDTSEGEIHYRQAGDEGFPLVMIHASPGSSKALVPLMGRLGLGRRVFAPDTWGNGDSAKPEAERLDISDYAAALERVLDALGLDQVDLYGTHTGACIALELAASRAERVRRVVLNGLPLWTRDEREELLATYAEPMRISWDGSHLLWAWNFRRDQWLFFPYFKRDPAHSLSVSMPSPERVHEQVMELLKSGTTSHLAYRAAFRYAPEERLPLVKVPLLLSATTTDPVGSDSRVLRDLAREALVTTIPGLSNAQDTEATSVIYERFFSPLP